MDLVWPNPNPNRNYPNPEVDWFQCSHKSSAGQWEKPFDANYTSKEEFVVDENTKVEVDMMKRTGRFDFYQDSDNHTSVVMLPYKGNTSMMIVLPDKGKMNEVEGYINKEYIRHWHDSLFRK